MSRVRVIDCVLTKQPPEHKIDSYMVYQIEVLKQSWKWRVFRSFPEIERLHTTLRDISKSQARSLPSSDKKSANDVEEFLNNVFQVKEFEAILTEFFAEKDASIEWVGEDGYSDAQGDVEIRIGEETEYKRYRAIMSNNKIELYRKQPKFGSSSKPERVIDINGKLEIKRMEKSKHHEFSFQVRSNKEKFRLGFRDRRDFEIWKQSFERASLPGLNGEQRKNLAQLRAVLGPDFDYFEECDLLRFLHDRHFNVHNAANMIIADKRWRAMFDISNIKITNIYDQLKTGKVVYDDYQDKQGRPILIFVTRLHDANTDFLETLRMFLYFSERATELIKKTGASELVIIDNLQGMTLDRVDMRMYKFIIDVALTHFPGRIGGYYAVHAPMTYRVIFEVVKLWLTDELLQKVHFLGDPASLLDIVDADNLPKELGGNRDYNIDQYIAKRAEIDGVKVDPSKPQVQHVEAEEIIRTYSDTSVEIVARNCRYKGWMKKQGGYVKKFNDRYSVLRQGMLYYFRGDNDLKAEGVVPLHKATVVEDNEKDTVFHIITEIQRDCIFQTDSVEAKKEWMKQIKLERDVVTPEQPGDCAIIGYSHSESDPALESFQLEEQDDGYGTSWNIKIRHVPADYLANSRDRLFQLADIAWQMKERGLKIVNRSSLFYSYARCATGKDIIEQLVEHHGKNKKEAKEVAQQMLEDHIFHVCDKHTDTKNFDEGQYYQFFDDIRTRCLNLRKIYPFNSRAPFVVLEDLFAKLSAAITAATADGVIDYPRLRGSAEYRQFAWASSELQQTDISSLSQEQQKGFFISLYNLLLAHTLVEYGPMEWPLAFWVQTTVRYQVNMLRYSLWDIYHGILRCNAVAPTRYHFEQLPKDSPQRKLVQEKLDARIHFCLGTSLKSALEGRVDQSGIEAWIQNASQKYVSENVRVKVKGDKKKIELGSLFDAFKKDFGKNETEIAQFAGRFLVGDAKQQFDAVIAADGHRISIHHRLPFVL